MNGIQIFKNEQFGEIRTLEINGQPYFVGVDVAKALGYANPRDALRKHIDNEDKQLFNIQLFVTNNTVAKCDGIQKRGNPNVIIINESGLYALIMSSKLPDAKKFKHWVTSEVLPSIRHTGDKKEKMTFVIDIFLLYMKGIIKNEWNSDFQKRAVR